jgi:hypothetical protein
MARRRGDAPILPDVRGPETLRGAQSVRSTLRVLRRHAATGGTVDEIAVRSPRLAALTHRLRARQQQPSVAVAGINASGCGVSDTLRICARYLGASSPNAVVVGARHRNILNPAPIVLLPNAARSHRIATGVGSNVASSRFLRRRVPPPALLIPRRGAGAMVSRSRDAVPYATD